MVIKITGSRQQIAELAHDIRMEGHRFNHALNDVDEDEVQDKQCLVLSKPSGRLNYYKLLSPSNVYATKELQAHLPSHRKHFLTQINNSYVKRKAI